LLLSAGADVHVRNDEALRWASKNGHLEVVKLLKQYSKKKKRVNESIKHLKPRSEEEIKRGMNKNIANLCFDFLKNGIIITGINNDMIYVENKKGWNCYVQHTRNNIFNIFVQGMSTDIPMYDIPEEDVTDIIKSINKTWMKENDPKGDQW
jgi:hypothetical protein